MYIIYNIYICIHMHEYMKYDVCLPGKKDYEKTAEGKVPTHKNPMKKRFQLYNRFGTNI